jgi:DNA polymerase-3 subunit chi
VDVADFSKFDRVLDLFDGHDQEAVQAARVRWKARQDAGHDLAYWQQSPTGGWEKKA